MAKQSCQKGTMRDTRNRICREGIIRESAEGRVKVHVTVQSACAACHAKGVCSLFETDGKVIEAIADEPLSPGEKVTVSVEERMAWRAILFAFILPMLLFGAILFFSLYFGEFAEPIGGLLALVSVGFYFIILHIIGKRLFRSITFHAKRISTNE